MNLVVRYLKAVAKALPEAQREDIIRELSEDVRSEMEDKQSDLGRPLTEEEQPASHVSGPEERLLQLRDAAWA